MNEQPDEPDVNPEVSPVSRPNVLSEAGTARPAEVRLNRLANAVAAPVRAAALPGVSTRWTGVVLVVCLVAAAVALPLFLHRSAWVEAEIVLLVWFAIWTGILTWLGYAGRPLLDDGPLSIPRPLKALGSSDRASGSGWGDWLSFGPVDLPGDDGCAGILVAIVAVVVLALILFVVVQFILPVVVAVLYAAVRLMLGRVAHQPDATRGLLAASVGRGAIWAAVFTGPLTLGVWLIHVVF